MAIRPDSDPKSASPRSGAPKGELEQYGVWVKAEPQDVIEEIAIPASEDFDFDLPGNSSIPEESFLSEDEEKLLGSFDSETEASGGSASTDDSALLPDIEDMPPLEESLLSSEPSADLEEISDFEANTIDISLDDLPSSHESSPIHPAAELDMETLTGLDSPAESGSEFTEGIEDVSSEFLDSPNLAGTGSAAGGPGSEMDDVTAEFLDSEDISAAPISSSPNADFEPLDIDLHFDDADNELPPAATHAAAGFEPVTEFDDFLASEPGPTAASSASETDFDDLSAVERDLSAPDFSQSRPGARQDSARDFRQEEERHDLSTKLLQTIAEELSSIRSELVSLKTRIGDIVVAAESGPTKASEAPALEEEESSLAGGFFDDEEDETIALTGDELDNILNTADFTEEAAETQQPLELDGEELSTEIPSPESVDLLGESLLPETGDYSLPPGDIEASPLQVEPAIEEVRLGQPLSIDEPAMEPLEPEAEDLSLFAEEGVLPMTTAPEDTSFLEAAGDIDIGLPAMSDEPLVEPDLSDFDLETDELEPRLEIDEELPLASLEPEIEEVTLGLEAGPDYIAEESAAEAEMLEPVPEIEETSYADINLHEEPQGHPSSDLESLSELDLDGEGGLETLSDSEFLPVAEEPSIDEDLVLSAYEGPDGESAFEPPKPEFSPPAKKAAQPEAARQPAEKAQTGDGDRLKSEIKSVLSYLDKLLDSLPEEKIEEFARSEYFDTYKKLFEELGLV